MKKMNKEEIIKALKKAVEHKKELCEQTEAQWAKEGVKGKAICLLYGFLLAKYRIMLLMK